MHHNNRDTNIFSLAMFEADNLAGGDRTCIFTMSEAVPMKKHVGFWTLEAAKQRFHVLYASKDDSAAPRTTLPTRFTPGRVVRTHLHT